MLADKLLPKILKKIKDWGVLANFLRSKLVECSQGLKKNAFARTNERTFFFWRSCGVSFGVTFGDLKIRKIAAEESWPQGLRDKRARTREHKCSSLPTRTASGQARPDFFDLRRTQSVGRPSLLNSSFFGGVLSRLKVEKKHDQCRLARGVWSTDTQPSSIQTKK